jgi:O-antigen/teichoic acid export membrane protein
MTRNGDLGRGVRWALVSLVVSRASAFIAVPLVLHDLGANLYAAWVLAGTLVLSQGLVDLGLGAALVRFVAVGMAANSRSVVTTVLWRAGIFYAGLSVLVAIPMLVFAPQLVDLVPYLNGSEAEGAAVLVRYAGVAFALTNATLVLDGLLRGLGGVAASYRAQTAGWIPFAPVIAVGSVAGWGVHGPGLAWVVTYGIQVILLGYAARRMVRRVPQRPADPPTMRQMLAIGGRWQASSWADFATFQLPRLVGGLALSSSALVSIDLSLRFGQLVVAPLLALYPVVLPAAAQAFGRGGTEELGGLMRRWYVPGAVMVMLATAVLLPLAPPAIATWSGLPMSQADTAVAVLILVGIVAHASTGLMSSALLATGAIGPVVTYKSQQLVLALLLVLAGSRSGVVWLAGGLAIALALPALGFNRRAATAVGLRSLTRCGLLWRRLLPAAFVSLGAGAAVVLTLTSVFPAWAVLLVAAPGAAVAFVAAARFYGYSMQDVRELDVDMRTVETVNPTAP